MNISIKFREISDDLLRNSAGKKAIERQSDRTTHWLHITPNLIMKEYRKLFLYNVEYCSGTTTSSIYRVPSYWFVIQLVRLLGYNAPLFDW